MKPTNYIYQLIYFVTIIFNLNLIVRSQSQSTKVCTSKSKPVKVGDWVISRISRNNSEFPECNFDYTKDLSESLRKLEDVSDARLNLVIYVPPSADKTLPLIFTVRQSEQHTLVKLPFTYDQNMIYIMGEKEPKFYYKAGGTLCINPRKDLRIDEKLIISVESESGNVTGTVEFSFRLELITGLTGNGLNLRLNNTVTTHTLSPSISTFYRFNFSDPVNKGVKNVTIITRASPINNSTAAPCTVISIQDPYCPILDVAQTVDYSGRSTEMLNLSVMDIYQGQLTVHRDLYRDGFALVIVVLEDDKRCRKVEPDKNENRAEETREVQFVLEVQMSPWDSGSDTKLFHWFIPFISIFLILCGTMGFVVLTWLNWFRDEREPRKLRANRQVGSNGRPYYEVKLEENHIAEDENENEGHQPLITSSVIIPYELFLSEFVLETGAHGLHQFIDETMSSNLHYFMAVLVVVVFHIITLSTTTDLSDCSYNKMCNYQVSLFGSWIPFTFYIWNSVVSSFSYILMGSFYLVFLWVKSFKSENGTRRFFPSKPTEFIQVDNEPIVEFGIVPDARLNCILGGLLILEGFLSAMQFVCPNVATIQIDAPVLDLIAFLSWIKVIRLRYPTYMTAGWTTFIAVLSTFFGLMFTIGHHFDLERRIFFFVIRIAFVVGYSLLVFLHCFYIYYLGYLRIGCAGGDCQGDIPRSRIILNIWEMAWIWLKLRLRFNDGCLSVDRKFDFAITVFVFLMNWLTVWTLFALFYFGLQEDTAEEFSQTCLYLIQANVEFALLIHFGRKWYHEYFDKTDILPFIFFILHLLCLSVERFYYYPTKIFDWTLSHAESSDLNRPCLYGGVYDAHDYFHFFKAAWIFFMLMTFSTINDGVVLLRREHIKVF